MLGPFRTGHFIFRHLSIGSSSWPKAGVKLAMASSGSSGTAREHSNRLVHERSPYLLQHAHNPVDWYPWGEEAFVKAQREDKPIFLSVGYSTCHWCHVMEVESFENEEVAKLLNDFFVSIKVDREERPDVDKVYMTFVQASQGGGGWPMSVFLTPELKPIVGGTYFPPNDAFGRPGFKSVLRQVKRIWDAKKDVIRATGDHVVQQLAEAAAISSPTQNVEKTFAEQALDFCANQLAESFDKKLGGFGGPPKFPRPVATNAMLWQYKRLKRLRNEKSAAKALESVLFTLNCMGRGGIHDHIGGGFHRYSVDEYWHVPHFEKMLYDQAQLVNIYLDAFIIGQDVRHAYVVRDILDYLKRDMTHDKGGIFSAEDADSAENEAAARKKEGAFYVWTKQEIENVLGHEYASIFVAHYYVKEGGNCNLSRMSDPHKEFIGKNVLIERQDLSETAEKFKRSTEEMSDLLGKCRKILFDHQNKRPRPHRDDKIIVAWNALAISAFARASRILKWEPKQSRHHFPDTGCEPDEYLVIAERIAIFIRDHLFDASIMRLQRCFLDGPSKAPGFLDDYAFLVAALIDLYEIGGSTKWLSWAIELQKIQDELFLDKAGGGYYGTPEGDASILFRVKEDYDGAEPSGNSIAALNLIRLSSFVSGEKSKAYLQQAEHLLAIFENRVREVAVALPMMCCAFDLFSVPSKCQVVIAGSKKSHAFNALVTAVFSSYNPMMSVIQVDVLDEEDKEFWQAYNPAVFSMAEKHATGDPVAYVCQNFTCQAPVNDPASLERLLKEH